MTHLTVKAVLLDMDGTLVDSTAMVETVWTEFAEANAVDPAVVIDFAHGRPSRDTIARYAADASRIDEWMDWITKAEAERFTAVTAIPGAVDAVCSLPPDRWAVVTSALHAPALERLTQVGFPRPRVLVAADDVTRGKPHPEGYRTAAAMLGHEPQHCVVFEDTMAGIKAGLAAGCIVVAVGGIQVRRVSGRIADFGAVTFSPAVDGELFLDFDGG